MPEGHAITGLLHRDNLMPGTGSMPVRQAAFVPLAVADFHSEETSPLSLSSLSLFLDSPPLICCLVSQTDYRRDNEDNLNKTNVEEITMEEKLNYPYKVSNMNRSR